MKKKRAPSELEGSVKEGNIKVDAEPSSKYQGTVYDCTVMVKAVRQVLIACTDVFSFKVSSLHQELPYEEKLVGALMELLQAIDLPAASQLVTPGIALKAEFLQMIELICHTLKVLTAHDKYKHNKTGLFEFLQPHLRAAAKLCELFDDRKDGPRHEQMCTAVVSLINCFRNLTHTEGSLEQSIEPAFIDQMFHLVNRFPTVKDIQFNCLRVLSKISTYESFCVYVSQNKLLLIQLIGLLETWKKNNFVIMRVTYILANLTAFQEDVATFVYFNDHGAVFAAFEHYVSKTKNEDDYYDSMIKSFAEFDFLNPEDKKVIDKVIRLMANMFTVEEPSLHFIKERFPQYKHLLKKLKFFMTENEVINNSELLISVLNCISNILYYDKPNTAQNDFELANLKQDLITAVAYIALQPKDEEILIEGLRVISNLSRSKNGVKTLLKIKFHEAILVLLKHRARDVVFYSIGILMNLSIDKDFKESKVCKELFASLVELLEECTIDDIDIMSCALKALVNIISDNLRNNDDTMSILFTKLDKLLNVFGEQCDIILASNEITTEEAIEIKSLRAVINSVVNVCPEEEFECTYPGCGRKFKARDQLEQHVSKRHR